MDCIGYIIILCCLTIDRPDYLKYRELLWKTMVLISDISEAQTELLSPLFLRFMKSVVFISQLVDEIMPTAIVISRLLIYFPCRNEYCHFEFTHNISQDFRRRQLNETIVVSSASQSSLPDVISDESFAIERQNENRSKCPGSFKRFE